MMGRRKEMRAPTRLQLMSLVGGLVHSDPARLQAALAELYHQQPSRWQAFMDEGRVLLDAVEAERNSGFAETVVPKD